MSVCAGSPESAWRLVLDNFIVHHIRKCTVSEAHRQMQNQTFALTVEELERFIAVMYARRVTEKVPYHCRRFGLKNEVCHCAKQQWLEIACAKFSTFSF